MNVVRCPSLLTNIMMKCAVMRWIWMLVIFYWGVLDNMMWMLSTLGRSNLYQLDKWEIEYTLLSFTRKNKPKVLQAEGRNFHYKKNHFPRSIYIVEIDI